MKAFMDTMTLYTETQAYGAGREKTRADECAVRCRVEEAGAVVSQLSAASGVAVTHQVIMWKSEYSGQNRAELDGVTYQVKNAVKTAGRLYIKLLLGRG